VTQASVPQKETKDYTTKRHYQQKRRDKQKKTPQIMNDQLDMLQE
jgi:hypothetical protein